MQSTLAIAVNPFTSGSSQAVQPLASDLASYVPLTGTTSDCHERIRDNYVEALQHRQFFDSYGRTAAAASLPLKLRPRP